MKKMNNESKMKCLGYFKIISRLVAVHKSRVDCFKMDKRMENSATCELRTVIGFLNAKNIKPAEIHRQIYDT